MHPFVHILVLVCFGWGFLVLGTAASAARERYSTVLVSVAAVLVILAHGVVNEEVANFVGTPATTDVRVYMDYAGWLLLQGENPYTHDLTAAYPAHRSTLQYATPLLDGTLTGRLPYPSVSFLVHVPALLVGAGERSVYLFFFVASATVLLWRSSPAWRPVVLLPFLIEPRYIGYAFSGVSDGVWAFWLVCLVACWHDARWRAVFLGLACATKQHAWIVAPFLALRVWHETEGEPQEKGRAVARLTGWSILVFTVVNAPFILWSPSAWWQGVFEPFSAPMITWGTGLSSISAWGRVDLPRGFWSFGLYGAWLLSLLSYARHAGQLRAAVWLLPGFVLFFGHRSLTSYWYYAAFPLVMELASVPRARTVVAPRAQVTMTLAGWVSFALVLLGVGLSFRGDASGLSVSLSRPMWVEGHRVNQLLVGVRNDTEEPIRPRFQVQTGAEQPHFWDQRSGPEVVEPGRTELFLIGTRVPYEAFEMARGAVLQVSAAGLYYPRASIRIEQDTSFPRPDRIPNPEFRFWADGGQRPQFWEVRGGGIGSVSWHGARGVIVSTSGGEAAIEVSTQVMEPHGDVEAIVRLPEFANELPSLTERYGLTIEAGGRAMLVLFGDREGLGVLPDGRPWVMLPAPRGTASRHTLNITQLLERVSLRPEPQRDVVPRFGHLDFPVRVIRLGFVLETDGIMGGRTVTFHGFENSAGQSAHKRYEHDLHAGAHRRWRAELALQAGEVDLAEELLGEQDSVATLYLNLAEDAWAAGSRMEVFDLLDSSEAHLRDSSHVARYLGLYERMGDVDEGRVRLEGTILRSLMVFGPASASGVWGGLLDHLVGVDCVRFREVRTWGESRGLASEGVWEEKSATCE